MSSERVEGWQRAALKLGAPGEELVARQRAAAQHAAGNIDGMHVDYALGQVNPYANGLSSCNLLHELPLSMASD